MLLKDEVQTLTELGLTALQANVYLALISVETPTAKEVANLSKVARQEAYRVINELQQLSLVEQIVARPARFRAVPIQEGVSILLERRIKKTSELQVKARNLIAKVNEKGAEITVQQENNKFVLIPEREALTSKVRRSIETAQESIQVVTPFRELMHWLFTFAELYNNAMRRGVTIQWVAEKPENANSWPEIVQTFTKNPHFKLRTITNQPKTKFAIHDKKRLILATLTKPNAAESPGLWTNNPALTSIIVEYFEGLWSRAREHIPDEY